MWDILTVLGVCSLYTYRDAAKSKAWVNLAADRSTFVLLPILYILVSLGPNPVIVIIINKRFCSRSQGFTQTSWLSLCLL